MPKVQRVTYKLTSRNQKNIKEIKKKIFYYLRYTCTGFTACPHLSFELRPTRWFRSSALPIKLMRVLNI